MPGVTFVPGFATASGLIASIFFDGALEGMLIFARHLHHLIDLGFGDLICENPTNADAALVDMQHDPHCLFLIHGEKSLKDLDDEFHGRVVVIQHQNLV